MPPSGTYVLQAKNNHCRHPVTATQAELNENTYKALGRFLVAFSGVLHALEIATIQLLAPAAGRGRMLLEAALADRTAMPIMSSFFSVFYAYWGSQVADGDKKVLQCLRRELTELIQIRNRLMHDAWMGSSVGGTDGPHPFSRLRVRAHGSGVEYEISTADPSVLEQLASDADRLTTCINCAVWYHRPGQVGPELGIRFELVQGKVQQLSPAGP